MQASDELIREAVGAVTALRRHGALVHCIANSVAQPFTANLLLACGATPSMTIAPDEIGDFVRRADALLVNLGTLDGERRNAALVATRVAGENAIPFVLDPVFCERAPARLAFARELIQRRPAILRSNRAEAAALEEAGALGKEELASCRVVTGSEDRIITEGGTLLLSNGHPWLASVIATGCAQGALMAALCVHAGEPRIAALAALLWFGIAAEMAATRAGGPGSFEPAFLDAMHAIAPQTLAEKARLT